MTICSNRNTKLVVEDRHSLIQHSETRQLHLSPYSLKSLFPGKDNKASTTLHSHNRQQYHYLTVNVLLVL